MYTSFQVLSVSNEEELRRPDRVRLLFWHYYQGLVAACFFLGLAGLLLWGGLAALWVLVLAGRDPVGGGPELYALSGILFFGGGIASCMAAAFGLEAWRSPLAGYPRSPMDYKFVSGKIIQAVLLHTDRSSTRKVRARGVFGEGGVFGADFNARLWSRRVAETGEEESLRPGDDRYDQKGRRARLPLYAWVIYHRARPSRAELAGLPQELVNRLEK